MDSSSSPLTTSSSRRSIGSPATRGGAAVGGDLPGLFMRYRVACFIASTTFIVSTLTVVTRASRSITLSL